MYKYLDFIEFEDGSKYNSYHVYTKKQGDFIGTMRYKIRINEYTFVPFNDYGVSINILMEIINFIAEINFDLRNPELEGVPPFPEKSP